jgi:hypothetical protein
MAPPNSRSQDPVSAHRGSGLPALKVVRGPVRARLRGSYRRGAESRHAFQVPAQWRARDVALTGCTAESRVSHWLGSKGTDRADSGVYQQLLRRHFEVLAPRGLSFPGDYQSMGFGLPGAIGAKLALPGRPPYPASSCSLRHVRDRLQRRLAGRIRPVQLAAHARTNSVELWNPDCEASALAVGASYALAEDNAEPMLRKCIIY